MANTNKNNTVRKPIGLTDKQWETLKKIMPNHGKKK